MRLAYIAPLPIDFDRLGGVQKKVLSHVNHLSKYFETLLFYYCDGKARVKNINKHTDNEIGFAKSKLGLLVCITRYFKKCDDITAVYCRYPDSDFFFVRMLRVMKRSNAKIVVEIPTYPYHNEGDSSFRSRIIKMLDCFFRRFMRLYVDRIVTFSSDDQIFGIKTIKTVNGIDFYSVEITDSTPNITEQINLVAVSAMFKVHGYERLIEGMGKYYANGGIRNIRLLLAGKGDELQKYTTFINRYGLEKHVLIIGELFGDDLKQLYKSATVGVNSLAIHRQGLKNESTLKSREYVAHGLPVVSSSYIDALSDYDNDQFVFRIPADESSVDVPALIKFVDTVYNSGEYTDVHKIIRDSARKICDFQVTFDEIIKFLG